jgi:hypothetical protein
MEKYFFFDRNKSLQELDGQVWDEPCDATHLILACLELRKKAIEAYSIEDLRIMIGQKIGLVYLVPLALELLEDDLFAKGNLYYGDLLDTLLTLNDSFWSANPTYKQDLEDIIEKNINELTIKLDCFRLQSI